MRKAVKILHLVVDDKFTDRAYELFEDVAPGQNDYYVLSKKKEFKYIKKTPVKSVGRFPYVSSDFREAVYEYSFVVIHSMCGPHQEFIYFMGGGVKLIWIGMGYDYYDLIYNNSGFLYGEKTLGLIKIFSEKKRGSYIRVLLSWIRSKVLNKKKLLRKLKAFSPVLEEEYDIISSKYDLGGTRYLSWNYGAVSDAILLGDDLVVKGSGILVGNSASLTNNHIEAFHVLSRCDVSKNEIICSLSYGDEKYAEYVEKYGKRIFGNSFCSLRKYLPYEEYVMVLKTCPVVIMNHKRQQAGGNVSIALYLGSKVYLDWDNPLYHHYNKIGVKVFLIQDVIDQPDLLHVPIDYEHVLNNRFIISQRGNRSSLLQRTSELIKVMST